MEFTIDFGLVRSITTQEYAEARSEIAALGPIEAYRRSIVRHDSRLGEAGDAPTLACRSGCSYCCHFSVDVRPVEVLNLIDHMQRTLSPAEQSRIAKAMLKNRVELEQLTEVERVSRNVPCPLLVEGRCSVYAARPQTCRNYHATDVAGCEKTFNEPDNLDIDPDYAPQTYQAGSAHVDAFSKAMADAGYDVHAYELNSAVSRVLESHSTAAARFMSKQTLVESLVGNEVALEFIDLDD